MYFYRLCTRERTGNIIDDVIAIFSDKRNTLERRGGLVVERRTPEREVGGFDPHSVSLSKIHLSPKKDW